MRVQGEHRPGCPRNGPWWGINPPACICDGETHTYTSDSTAVPTATQETQTASGNPSVSAGSCPQCGGKLHKIERMACGSCNYERRAYYHERHAEDGNNGRTHYEDCWRDGPRHYACAVERIAQLQAPGGCAYCTGSYPLFETGHCPACGRALFKDMKGSK